MSGSSDNSNANNKHLDPSESNNSERLKKVSSKPSQESNKEADDKESSSQLETGNNQSAENSESLLDDMN